MASEITTTIKLDPFYQRFLCFNFPQEDGMPQKFGKAFEFPARNDFSTWIGFSVSRCPEDYRTPQYGEHEFRIRIPYLEHKNPEYFNFISEKRQRIFKRMVHDYMAMLFHDELKKAIDKFGYNRMEAIDHLQEEFGFTPDDYDRLLKEYQRWMKKRQMQRYRVKKRGDRVSCVDG